VGRTLLSDAFELILIWVDLVVWLRPLNFRRAAWVAPLSRRLSGGQPARGAEGEPPSGQPARCRRYIPV